MEHEDERIRPWKDKKPFASLLNGDLKGALAAGEPAIFQIVMATHTGMTTEEFETLPLQTIRRGRNPAASMSIRCWRNCRMRAVVPGTDATRTATVSQHIGPHLSHRRVRPF